MADIEKIPELVEDVEIISQLGDSPGADNGLSSAGLKEKFDAAAVILKNHLNMVIRSINSLMGEVGNFFVGGSMLGPLNMNENQLGGLRDPVEDNDAASKQFVVTQSEKSVKDSRTSIAVVLRSDGWENNNQSVTAEPVTENAMLFVSPAPEAAEEYTMYTECGVRCSGQADGSLTFACEDTPAMDLTVNVALFF